LVRRRECHKILFGKVKIQGVTGGTRRKLETQDALIPLEIDSLHLELKALMMSNLAQDAFLPLEIDSLHLELKALMSNFDARVMILPLEG